MSCPTCNNSTGPLTVGGFSSIFPTNFPCNSNSTGCPSPADAKCTFYSGGDLACSLIKTNDSLELALQKIDTQLCATSGNYSTYNTFCLAPITTQQEFVEAISEYVCDLNTTVTTFIGTTFPAYQTVVSNRFIALEIPGTTSSCTSILPIANGDTNQTILQKISNSICSLNSALDLSSVDWNECFTVSPTPITVADGFNTLSSQICTLKASISSGNLPVFNNVGSCLPTPLTASDTLENTVIKIRTRLCQTPVFDINALSWNCVSKPSTTTTDIQSAMGAILAKLDAVSQNMPTFSGDFGVVATDPMAPCLGKTVSLSATIADRFVAATTSDNTPGTLQVKLDADANFAWDYSNPLKAKLTLVTPISGGGDGKVKTDSLDPTADYLSAKIVTGGATNGIATVPVLDGAGHLVKLVNTVDLVQLFTALLNVASTDAGVKALLCSVIASCPSPCAAPGNISIVYGGTTSSTTTTSTTGGPSTTTSSTTSTTTTAAPTTTTTSTTSTTTSSTTTTSTTVALQAIFVGAQSSATPPNGATVFSTGTQTLQNASLDVNANWVPFNATPQYCWIFIPNPYTKTKWYVDSINNGNIGGGGDTFGAPISMTVNSIAGLLYFTNFQTDFTANCLMKA